MGLAQTVAGSPCAARCPHSMRSGHQFYCIAQNRTQLWQGVEYKVEACVSISGQVELADLRATVKLENAVGQVTYSTLASRPASKREWALLKARWK